jgi:protein-tyrosine phosphatase
MAEPFRILVVCTANVCRSPMGELVLRRELKAAAGHMEITIASAGTYAEPGQPMCRDGAEYLDIARQDHLSHALSSESLEAAGLILTADREQRAACARLVPTCRPRLFTLRQAAHLSAALATSLAKGELPAGAPALPGVPAQRPAWFVAELDAARGTLAGRDDGDEDVEDRHGSANHRSTIVAAEDASASIALGLKTCLITNLVPKQPNQ